MIVPPKSKIITKFKIAAQVVMLAKFKMVTLLQKQVKIKFKITT